MGIGGGPKMLSHSFAERMEWIFSSSNMPKTKNRCSSVTSGATPSLRYSPMNSALSGVILIAYNSHLLVNAVLQAVQ